MEHVVFFPAHDGTPAFRRVASLDDAVRLVEHLRNVESVSEVSVHALSEVPLAFKTWYRVEVPTADGDAPATDEAPAASDEPPATATDTATDPATDTAVADTPVPSVEADSRGAKGQPVAAMSASMSASTASSNGQATVAAGPSSLGFFAS